MRAVSKGGVPPGFRQFNEVILIPKNRQADLGYVDPLKPLPKQWLDIISLIDQEKKERSTSQNATEPIQEERPSIMKSQTTAKPPLPRTKNSQATSKKEEQDAQVVGHRKQHNQLNIVANLS